MKVQVIGSGSMWTKYNSACYLIDDDIMVDFPNGACKYLYRLDIVPSSINHILLTHFHGDHYFDLPFYILNKSRNESTNTYIYCSPEGRAKINKIGKLAFPNSFNRAKKDLNLIYNFNINFNINNYIVKKLLVNHGRMRPAFGFIFTKNGINVGFTGDTALCESIEIMASKCKYLFCDCMFEVGTTKHQGINNIEYLAYKYPNCNFIVSHLEDGTRNKLLEMKISNVIVPEDSDYFIID